MLLTMWVGLEIQEKMIQNKGEYHTYYRLWQILVLPSFHCLLTTSMGKYSPRDQMYFCILWIHNLIWLIFIEHLCSVQGPLLLPKNKREAKVFNISIIPQSLNFSFFLLLGWNNIENWLQERYDCKIFLKSVLGCSLKVSSYVIAGWVNSYQQRVPCSISRLQMALYWPPGCHPGPLSLNWQGPVGLSKAVVVPTAAF